METLADPSFAPCNAHQLNIASNAAGLVAAGLLRRARGVDVVRFDPGTRLWT